ncbi:MAG: fructose-6-phosphate aldolase [Planctomycetota bacterium]
MKFFLDTANINEIKEANSWGIIDGVTTNPTHVSKEGRDFKELIEEICSIADGPISAEVVSTNCEGMLKEARDLAKLHKNIVIKIPTIPEGVKAIKILTAEGIKTNATLIFSAMQAFLVAKVGATYSSPFVGRLDAVGHEGMDLVQQTRQIYDNYGYDTQIIVAAVRHPLHVLEAALIGADVTTMRFDVMQQLFKHPLTDTGLAQFLDDWKKVPKGKATSRKKK